jgi:tetratricopeptide (TPR) repeat protein
LFVTVPTATKLFSAKVQPKPPGQRHHPPTLSLAMGDLKSQGNSCFAQGKYQEADDIYAACLMELWKFNTAPFGSKLLAEFAPLHGNRSVCLLKEGRLTAALEEAELACSKNPSWPKGFFRKAEALKVFRKYVFFAQWFVLAEPIWEEHEIVIYAKALKVLCLLRFSNIVFFAQWFGLHSRTDM